VQEDGFEGAPDWRGVGRDGREGFVQVLSGEPEMIDNQLTVQLPTHVPPVEEPDGSVLVGDYNFPDLGFARAAVDKWSYQLSAAVSAVRFFEAVRQKARVGAAAKILKVSVDSRLSDEEFEYAAQELLAAVDRGELS
jgi:hypothetical protein